MTRVLPLPAPARMSTGPSEASTASRCCGFNASRNDKRDGSECAASILQECLLTFGWRKTCGRRCIIKNCAHEEIHSSVCGDRKGRGTVAPHPIHHRAL